MPRERRINEKINLVEAWLDAIKRGLQELGVTCLPGNTLVVAVAMNKLGAFIAGLAVSELGHYVFRFRQMTAQLEEELVHFQATDKTEESDSGATISLIGGCLDGMRRNLNSRGVTCPPSLLYIAGDDLTDCVARFKEAAASLEEGLAHYLP